MRREEYKRKGGAGMGLHVVIPDMAKTFGGLYYAGLGDTVSLKTDGLELRGKFYLFFADTRPGEAVEALVLWDEGENRLEFDEPVTLVNPRVIEQAYKTDTGGTGSMLLLADGALGICEALPHG